MNSLKVSKPALFLFFSILFFSFCNAQTPTYFGMTSAGGTGGKGTIFRFNSTTYQEKALSNLSGVRDGALPLGNLAYDSANGLYYGMTSSGGESNQGTIYSYNPATNKYKSTVWSFGKDTDGASPYGSFTYNPVNGLYYGMTYSGGHYNCGTIFSFNPATNTETVLYSFNGPVSYDGQNPEGSLVYYPKNGLFYGMTYSGGSGYGSIFSFNTITNTEIQIHSFQGPYTPDAGQPTGSLVIDPVNGFLYGTAVLDAGTLFSVDPTTNAYTLLWNFGSATDGTLPSSDLVYDTAAKLFYGFTSQGGAYGFGTVYSFNPVTNSESIVWNFGNGIDYTYPMGNLIYDPATGLYYAMTAGGASGNNTGGLISFNATTGRDSALINWGNLDQSPGTNSSLIYNPTTGLLYGLLSNGGVNFYGALVSFNPVIDTDNLIWSFAGDYGGNVPYGSLTYDSSEGVFYGMTSAGGLLLNGSVLSFDPITNKDTLLWSLGSGIDGSGPNGSLVYNSTTKLYYGLTYRGGAYATNGTGASGAIISFNPATNTDSVLWSFGNGTDGNVPYGDLTYNPGNGLYYGMANQGGIQLPYVYPGGCGVIFSFNPATNTENVAWMFDTVKDGVYPYGDLTYYPANKLFYAMTAYGGNNSYGTIISFNPVTNRDSVLWSFDSGTDGQNPHGNLVYHAATKLFYAMTSAGGKNGTGTIISFNPVTNRDSVLWSFGSGNDGASPNGSLVYDTAGKVFFGTTNTGGANGKGAIIGFNPLTNKESLLWSFGNGADGQSPFGNLTMYPDIKCNLASTDKITNPISCHNGSDGILDINFTGGDSAFDFAWSNGSKVIATTNPTPPLKAGSYSCYITDAIGCTMTLPPIKLVNPPAIQKTQTLSLCKGDSVTVGSSVYDTTGLYLDVLTAANGCDSSVITNLTINPVPVVTVAGKDTIAIGTTDTLKATGATTYVWTGGSTTDPLLVSPATKTTYTVIGSNGGCRDTVSFTVVVNTITGMNTITGTGNTLAFPNPADETLNLVFTLPGGSVNGTVEIFTENGEEVLNRNVTIRNNTSLALNISNLKQGVYFVRITAGTSNQIIKFEKQ
jgi:uncharacterized repeat protein (TIGR03803 family)